VSAAKMCPTYPFSHSDRAENAINLGCVPSVFEIMGWKRERGLNWGCHSAEPGEVRPCAGFAAGCKREGLPPEGRHLAYADWYEHGLPPEPALDVET